MAEDVLVSLMKFLDGSPTMFHACAAIEERLLTFGFRELSEHRVWNLDPGRAYFVVRGGSSVIAFRLPQARPQGFIMAAAHTDSPSYRLRQDAEVLSAGNTIRLSVEMYGGTIARSWTDRPLSVAGRVISRDGENVVSRLVNVDRDLLVIPSLAIHLARDVNKGDELRSNVDMLPLFSGRDSGVPFGALVAECADVDPNTVLSTDLFLYPRQRATLAGANGEFLASPRIDNLECAWCALEGFLSADESESTAVYCVFNGEEVGSNTWQGAGSTFLADTLARVCESLKMSENERLSALANSFMVSADNAHAVHPAHPEFYDEKEQPRLNGGIVFKFNASQKYTTDGLTAALFASVCERAGVPVQRYSNRADLPGGSTLGRISLAHVSVLTVDIGLAQLAMHSCFELTGAHDPARLCAAMKEYYSCSLARSESGAYRLDKRAFA